MSGAPSVWQLHSPIARIAADRIEARCLAEPYDWSDCRSIYLGLKWTPDWDQGSPKLSVIAPAFVPSNQAASCCCFCVCCGYVGNAFALSKRSGISTVFAASILSVPARHAAMGNWLFIA